MKLSTAFPKILLGLAVAALTASAATNSNMLVSTGWLADHLNDPGLVILHVGNSRDAYDAAHIQGARYLALGDLAVSREGIPNELAPIADIKAAFEKVGVNDRSRVILYAEGTVLPATRAYFTMDYIGHGDQAALLDGGLDQWKKENRAVTTAIPQIAQGSLTVRPRPETLVSTDQVKALSASLANANAAASAPTLLDVRSANLFTGSGDRSGHIPGALNVDWANSQADGSALKAEASLRALYDAAGVDAKKPVVLYCNSGMQATQSYFTLKYLGYDVQLYDGSMSEWQATPGTTVAE